MATNTLTLNTLPLDRTLVAELRSDHAGEYGAVIIYDGILAVTRSPEVRQFALEHRETEKEHLKFMEDFLPPEHRTRLLPLWKVMAWTLGALPALFGRRAVYITIEAVETFVEKHYQQQLDMMAGQPALAELRQTLAQFCADEVAHKHDAAGRNTRPVGFIGRLWQAVVGGGSVLAVAVAKRI